MKINDFCYILICVGCAAEYLIIKKIKKLEKEKNQYLDTITKLRRENEMLHDDATH